jgi:hypothetical protein
MLEAMTRPAVEPNSQSVTLSRDAFRFDSANRAVELVYP